MYNISSSVHARYYAIKGTVVSELAKKAYWAAEVIASRIFNVGTGPAVLPLGRGPPVPN
jgi:hypothetical protein